MKNNVKNDLTRRRFFKVGIGTMGMVAATRAMAQVCEMATGKQPLGPFFPRPGTPEDVVREDLNPNTPLHMANDGDLTQIKGRAGKASGQVVHIRGKVTDADCKPIPLATLVVWQASKSGRYNHKGDAENHDFRDPRTGQVVSRTLDPYFQSWGRTTTDQNGEYLIKTIVPGYYPADLESKWYRPPHIHFMISATGYPQLVTQMYFSGEALEENRWIQELNQKDLLLQDPNLTQAQRDLLVVEFKDSTMGSIQGLVGSFDIVLKR
jgi:protocatechuate 3,4-dioxygenase beta subunit